MHSQAKFPSNARCINKMLSRIVVFQFLLTQLICSSTNNSTDYLRRKRFVKYPKGSAVGYIVALAIPAEDTVNNVFVAFNFEANFILPNFETDTASSASKYDIVKRSGESEPSNTDTFSRVKERFTRKNIYAALESQLFGFGLNGTSCILKTICQTAEISIYEHNGIFGSLFHIIFTPSSSMSEKLPNEVYEAELKGRINQCDAYQAECPISVLDVVTQMNQ